MASKQHAQFSDENGNLYYLESQTEDVLDASGNPLSNGGDLSEASVKFTVDSTRKLPQSGGRFKAFLGSIVKYLSDLKTVAFSGKYSDLSEKPSIPSGAAASYGVANNDTTTQAGFVADARIVNQHGKEIDQLSSELYAPVSGTGAMSVVQAVNHICENFVGRQRSARGRFACADFIGGFDIISDESGNCSGTIVSESETLAYSFYRRAGADAVLKKLGNATFSMTWHHNAQANVVAGLYSSIDLPGNYDTLQVTPKTVSPSNTTIAFKVNGETKQTITSAGATIDLSQYNADIIKLEIYDPYNGRVQVIADITLS